MIAHGFRKFFTTQLVNSKINPEIREMLLGHKIGLTSCYYKPSIDEMYSEYEKAIDNLTIDPANRLQRKIETLAIEKSRLDRIEEKMLRWNECIDNKTTRLTERERQFNALKDKIEQEKDLDIKQELKKGNIVTIIEDSMDY